MTRSEKKALLRGDVIRNRISGRSYVVMSNERGRTLAALTVEVENPEEWEIAGKVDYREPVKSV